MKIMDVKTLIEKMEMIFTREGVIERALSKD